MIPPEGFTSKTRAELMQLSHKENQLKNCQQKLSTKKTVSVQQVFENSLSIANIHRNVH